MEHPISFLLSAYSVIALKFDIHVEYFIYIFIIISFLFLLSNNRKPMNCKKFIYMRQSTTNFMIFLDSFIGEQMYLLL